MGPDLDRQGPLALELAPCSGTGPVLPRVLEEMPRDYSHGSGPHGWGLNPHVCRPDHMGGSWISTYVVRTYCIAWCVVLYYWTYFSFD